MSPVAAVPNSSSNIHYIPSAQNPYLQQALRENSLRTFNQPTLSVFPYSAAGQFDLGYGPELHSKPEPMTRQPSRSHTTQPPLPRAVVDAQQPPSGRGANTTLYDFPSTQDKYSSSRLTSSYSIYPSQVPRDFYGYEPYIVNPGHDNYDDIDVASDDTAFSPTSDSLITTLSDEGLPMKVPSTYTSRPGSRISTRHSIPTFVNLSASKSKTKSMYSAPSNFVRSSSDLPELAHSRSDSGSSAGSDCTLVSSTPSHPNPPHAARQSGYNEVRGRHSAPELLQSNSHHRVRSLSNASLERKPYTPFLAGSPIDTGSPWARYSADDIEAAYPQRNLATSVNRGRSCSTVTPPLMLASAGAVPVLYDEPEGLPADRLSSRRDKRSPSTSSHIPWTSSAVISSSLLEHPSSLAQQNAPGSVDYFNFHSLANSLPNPSQVAPDPEFNGQQLPPSSMSRIDVVRSRKDSIPRPPSAKIPSPVSATTPSPPIKYPTVTPVIHIADNGRNKPASSHLYSSTSIAQVDTVSNPTITSASYFNHLPTDDTYPSQVLASTYTPLPPKLLDQTSHITYNDLPSSQDDSQRPHYSTSDRRHSESGVLSHHRASSNPAVMQPQRRHSDSEVPSTQLEVQRVRGVRWNENLICPSPILAHQRRKGWFNRRGDQLWTNNGFYRTAKPGEEYPIDLSIYPECGQGWMNEEGMRIDVHHRLVPKVPLRSALKRKTG